MIEWNFYLSQTNQKVSIKKISFYNIDMRTRDQLRRLIWFVEQTKRQKYPNAKKLAEQFEISVSQAQRDIAEMKENKYLSIPLKYDYFEKGYALSEDGFEMIGLWASEEELLLFSLAKELLKDKDSKQILDTLLKKISFSSNLRMDKLEKGLKDHLFYKKSGSYFIEDGILQNILIGIINEHRISFTYNPVYGEKEPFKLDVFPLLILYYRSNWYLLAKYKNFIRNYSLSRISDVIHTDIKEDHSTLKTELKKKIRKPFGIFTNYSERKMENVKLLFNKSFARYIQKYIIHPEQKIKMNDDGSIEVTFESSINPELIGEILKFGANVRVISPLVLENEIVKTLREISHLY